MIFDTHCHLNSPELYLEHQKYIDNALLVGVKRFLIIGYDIDSSLKAIEIAKKHPGVCYAAIGIHPSEILKCQGNDLERIEELLKEDVVDNFANKNNLSILYKLNYIEHDRFIILADLLTNKIVPKNHCCYHF